AAVYELVDDNEALATAIRSAPIAGPGNRPVVSTIELAALTPADWTTFLGAHAAALPSGVTATQAGVALAARLAVVHPNAALIARLPRVDVSQTAREITALGPLFARNRKVVGVEFSTLSTSGLAAGEVSELARAHAQLVQLARAYAGLDLAQVAD